MNIILYRNDIDWQQEADVAKKYFRTTNSRMDIRSGDLVIPRFSALPFYKEQEYDIAYVGAKLINTHSQHIYIADLGNWYHDLKDVTPETWESVPELPEDCSFVVKGETNSKKYYWRTKMYAETKQDASRIQSELFQDSLLQYQKIYFRKYVPLEKLADGLQGLPISREYRFFIYKETILSGGFYWSSHSEELIEKGIDLSPDIVPRKFLEDVIDRIQNTEYGEPPNFYVIDVARTQEGKWIVIELNDGCMAGLSDNDPEVLYSNLKLALGS
jgi:hypothetical protein